MTYRGDDDADAAREHALQSELRAIEGALAEKPALEANRRALLAMLRHAEDAKGRRRAKVPLPLLARVHVASPCSARWDEMPGDERVRHCGACDKDVYDLSEMTTPEAEALLSREGPAACVRLHRRADGTVITSDCPVGARKKRRRRWLAAGAAVAGGVMAAAASLASRSVESPCSLTPGAPQVMGAIAVMPPPQPRHDNVVAIPPSSGSYHAMGGPFLSVPDPVDVGRPAIPTRPVVRARTRRAASSSR